MTQALGGGQAAVGQPELLVLHADVALALERSIQRLVQIGGVWIFVRVTAQPELLGEELPGLDHDVLIGAETRSVTGDLAHRQQDHLPSLAT